MSDTDHENDGFETTVEQRDGIVVVRISGKIIRENQAELRGQLEELIAGGAHGIAIDLEGVSYMDSAGLGCCASLSKRMRESRGDAEQGVVPFTVFNASPNIAKMWKLIRLDLVIPICAEEKEALALLPGSS